MLYIVLAIFFNFLIYLELFFWYFNIENKFHLLGDEHLNEYLEALIRFDIFVFITFLIIYSINYILHKKKYQSHKLLFYLLSFLNLIMCSWFFLKNIILNYIDVFELNLFIYLINDYGTLVNLVYLLPLLLSIINIILIIYFRFIFKEIR